MNSYSLKISYEDREKGREETTAKVDATTIAGAIVRSHDVLFLAEEGSIRTYVLAGVSQLGVYQGKKVRILGALESPYVIAVQAIDEVD